MTDKITAKIRALLALANNNPNQHEAALAAEKAQELMVAYNLKLSSSNEDTGRGYNQFAGGLYKWQRHLWKAIAALHFCEYWYAKGNQRGAKYAHKLLGRNHNVASAHVLAEYLESAINRLAKEEYPGGPREYFSKDANAYREGITTTLINRLHKKREAMKEAEKRRAAQEQPSGSTKNALTLTIADLEDEERWANNDVIHNLEPGTTKAEALARKAQYEAWARKARERAEAERRADELLKISDPETWAKKRAEEEKEYEKWRKKEARNARRRKGTGGPRPKPVPASYWKGVDDGHKISLDEQIDNRGTKKLT